MGIPRTPAKVVEGIWQSSARSPRKCVRCSSLQIPVPKSTLREVLPKRLQLHAYKTQCLHQITQNDKIKLVEFAKLILRRINYKQNY